MAEQGERSDKMFTDDSIDARQERIEELKRRTVKLKKRSIRHLIDPITEDYRFDWYAGMSKAPNEKPARRSVSAGSSKAKAAHVQRPPCQAQFANIPMDEGSQSEFQEIESQVDEYPFPNIDLYLQQLVQLKAYTLADSIGSVVVMRDFNVEERVLQVNSLKCVYRRATELTDTYSWVYSCSCSLDKHKEVSTLHKSLRVDSSGFQQEVCIHVDVCQRLLSRMDSICNIDAETIFAQNQSFGDHVYSTSDDDDSTIFQLNESFDVPHIGVLLPSSSPDFPRCGVLRNDKGGVTCITCRRPCKHVHFAKAFRDNMTHEQVPEYIQENIEGFFAPEKEGSAQSRKSIKTSSYVRIPFARNETLISRMAQGFKKLAVYDNMSGVFDVSPKGGCCPHCGDHVPSDSSIQVSREVPVFLSREILRAKVSSVMCSCGNIITYDGQAEVVLNMGHYLVGYCVLRDYLHHFLHGKSPFFTFFQTWKQNLADCGVDAQELSYIKFVNAWYGFVSLLDLDLDEGFSCPKCDGSPRGCPSILVCDGTSLAFRRSMLTSSREGFSQYCYFPKSSTHSDRVYVKNKDLRTLLKKYCSSTCKDHLTDDGMNKLMSLAAKESPTLHSFLQFIQDGTTVCPAPYRKFLQEISTNFSVCSIMTLTDQVEELMNDLLTGSNLRQHPEKWASLHRNIPVLFELFSADVSLLPLKQEFKELLQSLWNASLGTFTGQDMQVHTCGNVMHCALSYFPSLPQLHCRGHFGMDNATTSKSCSKTFAGHPTLLPGVFTVFCEHGVCYGFEIMETCESPNIPFTILSTRFERAPEVVVYDFACGLHAYCLNRCPVFFKQTKFLVDRFHWRNHKACPGSYNLSRYPALSYLNSQVNEQSNAGLKRIKGQLSYMTEEHFLTHCKLFLYHKNTVVRNSFP